MNLDGIKVIGFDADDTLWHNENLFRVTEGVLADLLAPYQYDIPVPELIYQKQMANLPLYGYGIKAFTFALLETAIEASRGTITAFELQNIINMGKGMLTEPVEMFEGVESVLCSLSPYYRLIVVTKGDLVDQERKLRVSGLAHYFHHIEIMSHKNEEAYNALLSHLDIAPQDFLMAGNSLKSDIIPVLNIGGSAIHIPYKTTWEHERADCPVCERFETVSRITDILQLEGIKSRLAR